MLTMIAEMTVFTITFTLPKQITILPNVLELSLTKTAVFPTMFCQILLAVSFKQNSNIKCGINIDHLV